MRRAATVGGAFVGGLVIAEVVARACAGPVTAPPRLEGEIVEPSPDPRLGWALVPGARMRIVVPGRDGTERAVDMRVGAHGWRGEPFEREKRPGSTRIGCVGDSHVFGWGVEDDETWPAQLGRALRERGHDVEVLNLGVPNVDLEHKARAVERVALELGCDVVLVELVFDDDALEDVRLGRHGGSPRLRAMLRPGKTPWLDGLRKRLRSVDLVADGLRRELGTRAYLEHHSAGMRPGHPARKRIDAALRRAREAARGRGAEIAAVVFPIPFRAGDGWITHAIDEELAGAARGAGLDVLELDRAYLATDGDLFLHPLDLHANARAMRTAAEATAEFLAARRWTSETSEQGVDERSDQRHRLQEGED